ncbi:hypothetical protein PACTADRAFT_33922 [Pachysolen tannophilus NRRL Y-2460]|uniref:Uncharacterized protein n=1 Tax=Pachysolen tannophilus NRRL Y-2460 TaxID=669874 RepID=A0A1E4TUC4_PACTA|nr:hypothetical protein PACTADRAFT_33922 [Pachysolen tannophilus NRRL Y-2460]
MSGDFTKTSKPGTNFSESDAESDQRWIYCPYQRYFARYNNNEIVPKNWKELTDAKNNNFKNFEPNRTNINIVEKNASNVDDSPCYFGAVDNDNGFSRRQSLVSTISTPSSSKNFGLPNDSTETFNTSLSNCSDIESAVHFKNSKTKALLPFNKTVEYEGYNNRENNDVAKFKIAIDSNRIIQKNNKMKNPKLKLKIDTQTAVTRDRDY